jgi:hypothetical protein
MEDLKQKTIRGGIARLCDQAVDFVLRIASLIVLARLPDPKDFGLVSMVTVVTSLYGLFSFGFGSAHNSGMTFATEVPKMATAVGVLQAGKRARVSAGGTALTSSRGILTRMAARF